MNDLFSSTIIVIIKTIFQTLDSPYLDILLALTGPVRQPFEVMGRRGAGSPGWYSVIAMPSSPYMRIHLYNHLYRVKIKRCWFASDFAMHMSC